jgi:hypothetical protein
MQSPAVSSVSATQQMFDSSPLPKRKLHLEGADVDIGIVRRAHDSPDFIGAWW